MKIKSVRLINLKSYQKATINFSKNINLLVGANNSGKSTIIKSLLNLQYPSFRHQDIRASSQYARVYTEITDVSENDSQRFYSLEYRKEFEIAQNYTIYWGRINNNTEEYLYTNSNYKIEYVEHDLIRVTDAEGKKVELKHFPRFPDNEPQNNFIYPFLSKRKLEYYNVDLSEETTNIVSENLSNLSAKIQRIGNPSHPKNKYFSALCKDILGFEIGVVPASQSNGNRIEPGIYTTSTGMIGLRSMGDGVANILGLIATLLTEDHKLYLVEELENDIHPKALKKLLDLILSKADKNQFVISTHSNIVLKHLGSSPESKIFYIEWDPKTERDGITENIPNSVVNEIENDSKERIKILEKLGYEFHDLELYKAYLILEESSAERIIRDFLIPNIVPELYNKIKTIAAQGAGDLRARLSDLNRLFVFIHSHSVYFEKAWIIADGDEAGKTAIKNIKKDFKSWPENHFINFEKVDFEEYYPDRFNKEKEGLSSLNDKDQKRKAKKQLLEKVMGWALKNREEAIEEFKVSASEVISILENINTKINNNQ